MTTASIGAPARDRAFVVIAAVILALATLVAVPIRDPAASSTIAATGRLLAVIVVGPAEGKTSEYVREARRIAAQLRSNGAGVREIYSPNATWSRVSEASRGTHLFVYLGHGRGYPSPHGVLNPRTMNGLGLNRTLSSGHANVRYYGEYYIRRALRLAPGAVVILNRVPYAAGSSEPGHAYPARSTVAKRADNYAAGFLGSGAAVVFASDRSVASIVRDLFGASRTMRSVFWRSLSTSTRYDSVFTSTRTAGASGILAPYSPGSYHQSVVGRLPWTTTDWQQTPSSPTVRVTSIPALLTALANDAVTEIVVANGTYRVNGASKGQANSLMVGSKFAGRTRPVLVRAETTGGVTFDGGGETYWIGLAFNGGAHDQTWQGFVFANGQPTSTGVITFGWSPSQPSYNVAAHHITLRDITIAGSVTSQTPVGTYHDHGIYWSQALGGIHDILIDGLTVDGSGGLDSAIHWDHSIPGEPNAWNVTVRRLRVTGTQYPIILWDPTTRNIVIEDATISGALKNAIRYEGGTGIVLRRVVSTGSPGGVGFNSSLGKTPPGVTFEASDLR